MIRHYISILWCLAFWGGFITGKSVLAGEWNDKPVMCAEKEETFFAINFLQALIFSIFGYLSVNDQEIKELDDVKYTAEAYVVPLILAILNAVLIYGLSDKIYL